MSGYSASGLYIHPEGQAKTNKRSCFSRFFHFSEIPGLRSYKQKTSGTPSFGLPLVCFRLVIVFHNT